MQDEQAHGVTSIDVDRRVGQVFRRLSMIRLTLGEPVFRRAVHAILVTLGDVVLDEAEFRARSLGPRTAWPRRVASRSVGVEPASEQLNDEG